MTIQIDSYRMDKYLLAICKSLVGEKISSTSYGKLDSSAYAEENDKIGMLRIYFESGKILSISQDKESLDDSEDRKELPLIFEFLE